MVRKYKARLIPEQNRRICGSICICQLTMVTSCVALVYLTVAIYMPSHRAFKSGIEPVPVMCETIDTNVVNNCQWASCGEWCLTKTSGYCPQIHVLVRRNGTDVTFTDCSHVTVIHCPPADVSQERRHNCNSQQDECNNLTGVFNCSKGHCANVSAMFLCRGDADAEAVNTHRDNIKLNGVFRCHGDTCTRLTRFHCDRYCPGIETRDRNVYLLHGNSVVTARCRTAYSHHEANGSAPATSIEPTAFWSQGQARVLMASCLAVTDNAGNISATDCVNGTLVDPVRIPSEVINFTVLRAVFAEGQGQAADPEQRYLPRASNLTLYERSRLYINLEGCVNTLQGECRRFQGTHGQDGGNSTARSRFPCYYDREQPSFVVARFDLSRTLRQLVVAVAVPSLLFVSSWASLCVITHWVRVGDDARMRCRHCGARHRDADDHDDDHDDGQRRDDDETNMIQPEVEVGVQGVQRVQDNRGLVVTHT